MGVVESLEGGLLLDKKNIELYPLNVLEATSIKGAYLFKEG
jgi:hypothetical protein